MIKEFRKEYFFLSNFYPVSVEYDGLTYPSSEAAFQAQKTMNLEIRKRFTKITPSEAKKLGKNISLRGDWEKVKVKTMYQICYAKFFQNADLKKKLIATGNQILIEENRWGDTFWGVCNGKGENHLGKCLMKIREEIKHENNELDGGVI